MRLESTFLQIRHRESRDSAAGPSRLKIEPTSDAVDVEALASEIEARNFAALHCFEIDFFETHAAAGDELVFEVPLALSYV